METYVVTQYYGELGTLEMYKLEVIYTYAIVPDTSSDADISEEAAKAI